MKIGDGYLSDLKEYITDIPDFPEKGIIFHDVTSLLQSGEGYRKAVDRLRRFSLLTDILSSYYKKD